MKVLSVNAGSSSLKFKMFEMPEKKVLVSGLFERIGISGSCYTIKINGEKIKKEAPLKDHKDAVKILTEELIAYKVIDALDEIKAVGHRMVHGGSVYASSVIIDEDVKAKVKELIPLAPLHNPANLIGIEAFESMVPNAVNVGVFDTAFHQTMDEAAYLYPVPYEWYEKYGVRKYGFHGTSHQYVANRMNEILGRTDTKLITCHIGNGGSISAVLNGKCIDTSMGFTPNAGIMMGSRSGDIDASIVGYIMEQAKMDVKAVDNALNKESGLLGISGISSDSRDIEQGIEEGNARCKLAQEMYIRRIVAYIAQYYVLLGGADAIVMTAGVGENAIAVRKAIINRLAVLGIKIDEERNNIRGEETLISSDDSTVKVYVIPTDEELMIACDTYNLTLTK